MRTSNDRWTSPDRPPPRARELERSFSIEPHLWGRASGHPQQIVIDLPEPLLPCRERREHNRRDECGMRTIAIVNQKGGCGKTITSINLSAFLAREQRRVLLVDMDPQGHATLGLLTDAAQPSRTMYEVFLPDAGRPPTGLGDVIRPVRENLDVAPSDILLSAIPETLAGRVGREDILSEAMASVEGRYDYVIVDCPPNVGLLTFNKLNAC